MEGHGDVILNRLLEDRDTMIACIIRTVSAVKTTQVITSPNRLNTGNPEKIPQRVVKIEKPHRSSTNVTL
jgi:hypothetical protein